MYLLNFVLFVLLVALFSRCSSAEEARDWFGECKVVSCSLQTQVCDMELNSETKFFHNGGVFYCPPGGEYDYITWRFTCDEDGFSVPQEVLLLPTAAEHRIIGGVSELDTQVELDGVGIRSTSKENVAIMVDDNGFSPFLNWLVALYEGADGQIDSFFECNGETLQVQARDEGGKALNLTLEGPLPRFDDTIVDWCSQNASTCVADFACAECNEDKSVDSVAVVWYNASTNKLIEASVSRTRRGSKCPIKPTIVYDDEYAYVFQSVAENGDSVFLDLLESITASEGLLKFSQDIFSCRSSPTNVSAIETPKPEPAVESEPEPAPIGDGAQTESSTAPASSATSAPSEASNASSPAGAPSEPEEEEVCVEASWLRAAGVRDAQMLHEKSIVATVLCPRGGVPCGTRDHLLLKDGALLSYGELCALPEQRCERRRAAVNSVDHWRLLRRASIHFETLSVTACSGRRGSWQRCAEHALLRPLYAAHRAWHRHSVHVQP